jgi:hypothetical protein
MNIPSRNFALTFYVEWAVRISSPFPLQSHTLTFFVSFFLLTSLRLDIYLSAPPYSWLNILYLKIWHRPSGSTFIPRHNRNNVKQIQFAIFVCCTVTCMHHMLDCSGVRSKVRGLQTYLKRDFQLHLRTTPASFCCPEACVRTTFTVAPACSLHSCFSLWPRQ